MPKKLLLHPTSCAQWQALLFEGQKSACIQLTEDIESYLVFLLMRFASEPQVAKSVLGLEFLQSQQLTANQQPPALKDVGDKCLLFSGLFPQHAHRRRVDINYFVSLGQTAYQSVAQNTLSDAELFTKLYEQFSDMTDVLHATREASTHDLMQMMERWQLHGSQYAFETMTNACDGLPCMGMKPHSSRH